MQEYTYVLGGAPNEALPTMFGGYFTDTNTGSFEYGTYLEPRSSPTRRRREWKTGGEEGSRR